MKKLILALSLLLCATTSLFSAQQAPTEHPYINAIEPIQGTPDTLGIPLYIIFNDSGFLEERNTINTFIQRHQIANITYGDIRDVINTPLICPEGGLEVLESFERAIMHYLHKQNYIVTHENKWLNIFVTGIRRSWVTPAQWMPSYWYSDQSTILQTCMDEISNLARIAAKYSTISSARMKATVESYLNWRRNALITIAAYLGANLALRRDLSKSPLKIFFKNGLLGSPKVVSQIKDDIVDFTTTVCSPFAYVANFCLQGLNTSNPVTTSNPSSASSNTRAQSPETANPKTPKSKKNKESYYAQYVRPHNKNISDYFSGFFKSDSNNTEQQKTTPIITVLPKQDNAYSAKLKQDHQTVLHQAFLEHKNAKNEENEQQHNYNLAKLIFSHEEEQKALEKLKEAQQKTKKCSDAYDQLAIS